VALLTFYVAHELLARSLSLFAALAQPWFSRVSVDWYRLTSSGPTPTAATSSQK
jgi:hypothetical protein